MGTKESPAKPRKLGRGLSSLLGHLAPVEVVVERGADGRDNVAHDTMHASGAGEIAAPDGGGESHQQGATTPSPREAVPVHAPISSDDGERETDGKRLVMVSVGGIVASRWQPRRHFDEGALARLAESIKSAGVMQPLVVRSKRQGTEAQRHAGTQARADGMSAPPAPPDPQATPAPGGTAAAYELVAGERRWRAATMAGIARVPCVVVEITDEESAEWGLIENVQREDLRPMERAGALANLATQFSLTQSQVAERVGLERSSVANLIRLLDLDPKLQRMIDEGALSAGHGKALLAVPRESARVQWGVRAATEGWSVRTLEQAIGRAIAGVDEHAALKDEAMDRGDELPDGTEEEIRRRARKRMLADLEKRLSEKLGTKVQLRTDRTGNRGKVLVHFYTVAQFDGLLEKLGVGEGE